MYKLLATLVFTLLVSGAATESFASFTSYVVRGQVNGTGPYIQLGEFDVTRAASSLSEILPSGTKHVSYKVDSFDFVSPNFDFNIYNNVYGGIFIWAAGANARMQVDQYLQPTGSSALSVTGSATPACHGGCLTTFEFSLDYSSHGSELFGDLASPNKLRYLRFCYR